MPAREFDPAAVHQHLEKATESFHALFDGHVPDEVHRFDQFLATLEMIVDQSADMASKEESV